MSLRHEAKPDAEAARQATMESYRRLAPELLRAAHTFSADAMFAQDALQEVFLRFFLSQMQGERILDERAWLHCVLRHLLIDAKRGERAHPEIALEERIINVPYQQNGSAPFEWKQTAERVLAPREWECIRLRADGMDYREIASALQIRPGTVAALLHRATSKLRRVFLRKEQIA